MTRSPNAASWCAPGCTPARSSSEHDDVAGIAVHIASRVAALAGPGEILASRTVVDLTAGSGITFDPRGDHQLKGVPGDWPIFAAY